MIATIVGINYGVKMKGQWDGLEVIYQGEPYQGQQKDPVTRFVFKNSDVYKQIVDLEIGDKINLTFEKNGKFSNLVACEKIGQGGVPTQGRATPSSKQDFSAQSSSGASKDVIITRAVAFKGAVELVCAGLARDKFYKAGMKMDLVKDEVKEVAKSFEDFLSLMEKEEEAVVQEVSGEENPFED